MNSSSLLFSTDSDHYRNVKSQFVYGNTYIDGILQVSTNKSLPNSIDHQNEYIAYKDTNEFNPLEPDEVNGVVSQDVVDLKELDKLGDQSVFDIFSNPIFSSIPSIPSTTSTTIEEPQLSTSTSTSTSALPPPDSTSTTSTTNIESNNMVPSIYLSSSETGTGRTDRSTRTSFGETKTFIPNSM